MSFFQITISLFFVLNAIGSIPLFVAILGKFPVKRQRKIIIRELLIALGILLLFNFFGDDLLYLMGISQPIMGIAGGTLLFIIALTLIFPKPTLQKKVTTEEPLIVPLAIPLIAGPGALTSVMIYAEQARNHWIMTAAILLAWLPSALILFSASNIKNLLGTKGLTACERLGGMLISLIAVNMIANGILTLLQNAKFQ